MKKYAWIVSVSICLLSCSNIYEQQYKDYAAYNNGNGRNKSWFPDNFIFNDAYNLRSASCLDSLSAFGEFNYSKPFFYDSVFSSNTVKHITPQLYAEKIKRNRINMPEWFQGLYSNAAIEFIHVDRFYIARDRVNRKISFVLSN